MHEASLVEELLSQVGRIVADQGGGRVTRVGVIVGALSGVEPDLVRFAFDRLAPEAGLPDAELAIEHRPVEIECSACHAHAQLDRFIFRCPHCGSSAVELRDGDQFILQQIVIADDELGGGDAVLGSWFLVLGSSFFVLGSSFVVCCSSFVVLGSSFVVLRLLSVVRHSSFLFRRSSFLVFTA